MSAVATATAKYWKPVWSFLTAAWRRGKQIAALEARVTALEEQLAGPYPPDICKFCGERQVRLVRAININEKAILLQDWRCTACNKDERRMLRAQ